MGVSRTATTARFQKNVEAAAFAFLSSRHKDGDHGAIPRNTWHGFRPLLDSDPTGVHGAIPEILRRYFYRWNFTNSRAGEPRRDSRIFEAGLRRLQFGDACVATTSDSGNLEAVAP